MGSDGADVICCKRLFQICTAATEKLGHRRAVEYMLINQKVVLETTYTVLSIQ